MDKDKNIEPRPEAAKATESQGNSGRRLYVWAALVLAVAAWLVLWFGNGYVSIAIAALACVAGFMGVSGSKSGMRRLAVAAVIAAMVLVVVVAAYLIVLKVGLRV